MIASNVTPSRRKALSAKQADKRYASLFTPISNDDTPVPSWQRQGTGITVTIIQHDNLTEEQFEAIGEYRLEQYILAGLYDEQRTTELGLTVDPNLLSLPGSTIHVLVGDCHNHLLCYASFEPAHTCGATDIHLNYSTDPTLNRNTTSYMHHCQRPLFAVEIAFGQELYSSHPEISKLPLTSVREMMRMVRNQAIRVPTSSVTPIEVIVAASRLLRNPTNQIEAIVGCASPELRKLSHRLRIPVAYAPEAVDHLRERTTSPGAEIWTQKALEQGRFWPLAISVVDIKANADFFDALDTALDATSLKQVLLACRQTQQYVAKVTPHYCYVPPLVKDRGLQWVPYQMNDVQVSRS